MSVVVTGVGVLAPCGIGRESFWSGLLAGGAGPKAVPGWTLRHGASALAFSLPEFDPKKYVAAAALRRLDRTGILAIAAAKLALEDAKLAPVADRTGIVVGAGACGVDTTSGFHRRVVETNGTDPNPMAFPNTVPNAAAGQLAIALGITGYNTTLVQTGASAEEAIALAADLVASGRLDAAIAGGVDELAPLLHHALGRLGGLSRKACRPFDRAADGTILGEDAAFVVLERSEDAAKRGAKPLATLAGHGRACHGSRPLAYAPPSNAAAAMRDALRWSGVAASDVAWVNSPANGTRADARAAAAISETCPNAAVSSVCGACGDGLAIGGVRAAASVLACAAKIIPPSAGLANPAFPLDFVREPRALRGAVLQHAAGTGGADACLVWTPLP